MNNVVPVVGFRAICFSFVLALARAQAADFYVSTQGSDSNAGTSSQPFRTITYAYSKASAGTTIHVLPGIYSDYRTGWGIHLGKSGTAASPIVLKSEVRGGAIIDGQNASDRNQGFYMDGNYNVVDGFEIRNCPHGGVAIYGNGNRIVNNEIHHNGNPADSSPNGKDGVYSDEGTSGNFYGANSIHDNGRTGSNLDHGLYLCGRDETVINNLLFRNAATGLQIAGYTTVSNMKVYNNVVAWNGTTGIILWLALSGVDIKNNIIYRNGNYGLGSYDAHGSGVVVDRNLCFGNGAGSYNFTGGGSDFSYSLGTTVSSDPLFVNGTSSSFNAHLGSVSPATGAGLNLYSVFTTDKEGTARSASGAWDLGAYVSESANTAPTISSIANQTISASSSTGPLAFTVADAQTPAGSLTVSGGSSNPTLLPNANIVFGGSGANRTVTATPASGQTGIATITLTVSDGSMSARASFTLTVNALAAPVLPLAFSATSGTISAPFYITNGTICQPAYTGLTTGGRAAYAFTVPATGDYVVSAMVSAPTADNNSFYVNMDAEPTDLLMIWDIPITTGLTSRTVSWRGAGTADANEFSPKVFTLSAGTHELIVRGREGNCQLGDISIVLNGATPAAATLRITMKAGNTQVRWPTNSGNYMLQSRTITGPMSAWVDLTNTPVIDRDQYLVDYPSSGGGRLYRLRSQ